MKGSHEMATLVSRSLGALYDNESRVSVWSMDGLGSQYMFDGETPGGTFTNMD